MWHSDRLGGCTPTRTLGAFFAKRNGQSRFGLTVGGTILLSVAGRHIYVAPIGSGKQTGWGRAMDVLQELEVRREAARAGGGARRIEVQHGRGKLTARERVELQIGRASCRERV